MPLKEVQRLEYSMFLGKQDYFFNLAVSFEMQPPKFFLVYDASWRRDALDSYLSFNSPTKLSLYILRIPVFKL